MACKILQLSCKSYYLKCSFYCKIPANLPYWGKAIVFGLKYLLYVKLQEITIFLLILQAISYWVELVR